jgi:hypothetical protein
LLIISAPLYPQSFRQINDHGIPIQTPNRISYKTAYQFGANKDDLLCWTTTAESGGQFIAMFLKNKKIVVHQLGHLEAYPIVFGSNGIVYVGSTSGSVMSWDPVTDTWREAGSRLFNMPNSTTNHVRVLCEGKDGWLYAGSCYGERARLNMISGNVEYLPTISEKGNWYISSATTLSDGRIAFGTGYRSRIIVYDPLLQSDVAQWMPEEYQKDGFCFNILAGKEVMYATHFPSGHRLSFDVNNGTFLGKLPWPDLRIDIPWSTWNHSSGYGSVVDFYLLSQNDAIITSEGNKVVQYHPKNKSLDKQSEPNEIRLEPEIELALQYEVTSDCRVLRYDNRRKKVMEEISPSLPIVERDIFSLTVGPDKNVYGGAYQSTLLFRFNTSDGMLTVLGDHHPGWSGETFSYTNRGNELITASYTNGAVVAFDPRQEWKCYPNNMINPRRMGFLGQFVYRPLDICVDTDGDLWAVGPAGWGTTGGGLARLSYSTKYSNSHHFNDVPHSVFPISDRTLIVCSDTLIRWWDLRGDSLISQYTTPFISTSLCKFESEGDTLFFISTNDSVMVLQLRNPGTIKITSAIQSQITVSRLITNNRELILGGNKGIAVLDPSTLTIEVLTNRPLHNRYAFAASDSTVYFSKKGNLLSINYKSAHRKPVDLIPK